MGFNPIASALWVAGVSPWEKPCIKEYPLMNFSQIPKSLLLGRSIGKSTAFWK